MLPGCIFPIYRLKRRRVCAGCRCEIYLIPCVSSVAEIQVGAASMCSIRTASLIRSAVSSLARPRA
jgi:hypothetical protein